MKLYTHDKAPNPRRINIFLAEKGLELPSETVDLMAGEHLGEAYAAINPLKTAPALQLDDGTTLTQVVAMYEYLEAAHPQPPLLGSTPTERALVREWMHRTFMEGFAAVADAMRNSNPAFANRALPGPLDLEQIPALAERGMLRLKAFLAVLDERLAGRDFVAIDAFSAADIDAYVFSRFVKVVGVAIPDDHGNLLAWQQRIGARPGCAV
jgi:glutathione S-transferase